MINTDRFHNKRILLLGFGTEGQSSLQFFRKRFSEKSLGVADRTEPDEAARAVLNDCGDVRQHFGSTYLDALDAYDVIVRSPGFPFHHPALGAARKKGAVVTSQTDIFLADLGPKTIGVTATKGKSTIASLIHHILTTAGKRSQLIGNIGVPALSLDHSKDTQYFVYELSSHQLADTTASPHIAVVANIYPDHLDYYYDFAQYTEAKQQIFAHQKAFDVAIYNQDIPDCVAMAKTSIAAHKTFSTISAADCFIDDGVVKRKNHTITTTVLEVSEIPLLGMSNTANVLAAVLVTTALDVPLPSVRAGITTFTPLHTRLEHIGKIGGIDFYDDALATVPQATIAALDALVGRVHTLIAGGMDRGQEFDALARAICHWRIGTLILFPDTGENLWEAVKRQCSSTAPAAIFVSTMEDAVKHAFAKTAGDAVCLHSPAAASFTVFKNYKDRSAQFRRFVKEYALTKRRVHR